MDETAARTGRDELTWMAVVAVLVVAQKLLPPTALIDMPVAIGIVALGIVTAVAPMM